MNDAAVLDRIIARARRRLWRQALGRWSLRALLMVLLVLLVPVAARVGTGGAVPGWWWLLALIVTLILVAIGALWLRPSPEAVARLLDRHCRLHDALLSHRHLPAHDPWAQSLRRRLVHALPPDVVQTLPRPGSRMLSTQLSLMLVLSVTLGMQTESDRLQDVRRQAVALQELLTDESERLVTELEEILERHDEHPELRETELRRLLAELGVAENRDEALRRLAALEMALDRTTESLNTHADEALLQQAAHSLQESGHATSRNLGRSLEQHDYQTAAQSLEQSLQQADTAACRDLARRLTDPAQQAVNASEALRTSLKELRKASQQLQKSDCKDCGTCSSCAAAAQCQESGKRLAAQLRDLDTRRRLNRQLLALRQRSAGTQNAIAMNQSAGTGIGNGSQEPEGQQEIGQTGGDAQVALQDGGSGASSSRVLDSAPPSGADGPTPIGSSGGKGQHDFQRQVERFVQREDVPPALRDGVRAYFIGLHQ